MLAAATLAGASLSAQESVRVAGRVFDEEHLRKPGIVHVRVLLVSTQETAIRIATLSDEVGHFRLDSLVPGRYQIRMSRIGYTTIQWERNFQRADDTLTVGMRPANGGDGYCPTDTVLKPGFGVMVRDQNAEPVVEGITIIARSATSVDTLRAFNGMFGGRPSGEGTYVFEITGPGFHPMRSEPFNVRKVPPTADSLCGISTPSFLFVERIRIPHRPLPIPL
jgi:hypothetical protein